MGKEASDWFSRVFNTVYTSCRTNNVKPGETTAWFAELPGVRDRERKTSAGSSPNM